MDPFGAYIMPWWPIYRVQKFFFHVSKYTSLYDHYEIYISSFKLVPLWKVIWIRGCSVDLFVPIPPNCHQDSLFDDPPPSRCTVYEQPFSQKFKFPAHLKCPSTNSHCNMPIVHLNVSEKSPTAPLGWCHFWTAPINTCIINILE